MVLLGDLRAGLPRIPSAFPYFGLGSVGIPDLMEQIQVRAQPRPVNLLALIPFTIYTPDCGQTRTPAISKVTVQRDHHHC